MGLTTHVLDTSTGKPAAGLKVTLNRLENGTATTIVEAVTNSDGRCDAPLIADGDVVPGTYELIFRAGDYFDAAGTDLPDPKFLDVIPIRFGMSDPSAHYHVPLLLSPFGYSTYRGS